MPYVPLVEHLEKIAEKETRHIKLLTKDNEFKLPEGEYTFIEIFCDECDCRRVMFVVKFINMTWSEFHVGNKNICKLIRVKVFKI
jgi:hypothetical protein